MWNAVSVCRLYWKLRSLTMQRFIFMRNWALCVTNGSLDTISTALTHFDWNFGSNSRRPRPAWFTLAESEYHTLMRFTFALVVIHVLLCYVLVITVSVCLYCVRSEIYVAVWTDADTLLCLIWLFLVLQASSAGKCYPGHVADMIGRASRLIWMSPGLWPVPHWQ